MTDPYKVLGVSPDIPDEELKRVYRDLARKYHPDSYVNNPLADLAAEKMKEINEAYDEIQRIRKGQSGANNAGYGSSSGGGYTPPSHFADIRRLIQANRISDAEELLNGVPEGQRDAEWYFLKGNVYYTRGWLDEAMRCFTTATQMDPQNMEYQAAMRQMSWQRNTAYPSGSYGGGYTMRGGCCGPFDNMCCNLVCADCCCEAMGGDLCPCI